MAKRNKAKTRQKSKNWVDFKEIKGRVSLKMVLDHYGIELKQSGKNWVAPCPIHGGDNPRAFSADLEKNGWHCFSQCQKGGNQLDFVALKEFGDNSQANIRKAAKLLRDWFPLSPSSAEASANDEPTSPAAAKSANRQELTTKKRARINKPLPFKLKNLETDHPWFEERSLQPKTVEYFGLGLQKKGKTIAGRIAIPIHNEAGELVAYIGRAINDQQAKEEGKYKAPANFLKSLVVYNLHRQAPGQKLLIGVESFISVWWLHQAGYPNAVALMGSSLSPEQEELIINYFAGRNGGLILMFDNDEAGQKCAHDCLLRLGKKLFVTAPVYKHLGEKPHHLKPDDLKKIL